MQPDQNSDYDEGELSDRSIPDEHTPTQNNQEVKKWQKTKFTIFMLWLIAQNFEKSDS